MIAAGYFGLDLTPLLQGEILTLEQSSQQGSQASYQASPAEQRMADFTAVVLAKTEDLWRARFKEQGMRYREPTLVIYSGSTSTACGYGQVAMGPFYCPADEKVYLDLSFYNDMKRSLGAVVILLKDMWLPMKWGIMYKIFWEFQPQFAKNKRG